jgi:hypothetical protein
MIQYDEIDDRLKSLGLNRAWLAEVTNRSAGSIRAALAPNSAPKNRTALLLKALSDAIMAEEERRLKTPPGYTGIFLTDEEINLADRASRLAGSPSLASFCHDVILNHAKRLIDSAKLVLI